MNINTPRKKIVVLGGTGFVGQHLCAALVQAGHRVRVLSRNPDRAKELTVLPTLTLKYANIYQQDLLNKACEGADVLINLVGILNEDGHRGSGFRKAHVTLAQKVVATCLYNHIPRLLHMSALNADASKGRSYYLRTKGEAESYVHAHHVGQIHVTSFRPSVMFGPNDSFLNRFADLLAYAPGIFPLPLPNSLFAPIYVGDVVNAMIRSLDLSATYGQRYELCGPKVYTLKELVTYIAKLKHMHRLVIGLPLWLSSWQANMMEYLPGKPFSRDNYLSALTPSVCQQPMPKLLGLNLTPLESIAPLYLLPDEQQHLYDQYRAQVTVKGS